MNHTLNEGFPIPMFTRAKEHPLVYDRAAVGHEVETVPGFARFYRGRGANWAPLEPGKDS